MRLAFVIVVCCFASAYGLPSILDIIASNNASTILQLVNQAGLADTLRQSGKFIRFHCEFCIEYHLRHVSGALGCFNGPKKDKAYAYLPNLARHKMGKSYCGLLVNILNVRRVNEILFALIKRV